MKKENLNEDKLSVTLSLRGNHLVPDEISSFFDLKPSNSFQRGDIFIPKHGNFSGKEVKKKWGVWQYCSSSYIQSKELDDHLEYILKTFEDRINKLQRYLDDDSYDITMYILFEGGVGVAGFGFRNVTLLRMMKICKGIHFTLCLADEDMETLGNNFIAL